MGGSNLLVAVEFAATVPDILAVVDAEALAAAVAAAWLLDAAAAIEVAFAMIPVLFTLATVIVSLGMVILAAVHPARYSTGPVKTGGTASQRSEGTLFSASFPRQ